jgi:tetratricopeptide (TPR) repeat protein
MKQRWTLVSSRGGVLLVVLLLFLGLAAVGSDLDRREGSRGQGEKEYLIPAEHLKPFLCGYEMLAADLLWLETVQYLGKHLLGDQQFPQLLPRLRRIVSLDPNFLDVYRLGAIFLAYSAGQEEEAIRLLQRAAALLPHRWEPAHDLGTLYYLRKKDYAQALYWLNRANALPGRPDYVPRFVARLYASTGERETAVEMWIGIYRQTDLDWVKDIARRELRKLGVYLPQETPR